MCTKIQEMLGIQSGEPSAEELFAKWKKKPERYFVAQRDNKELKWEGPIFGSAPMFGCSDSHGQMEFPDMRVSVTLGSDDYTLAWVEGISMVEGGIVRISHFALDKKLEGRQLGVVLYNAILSYFKNKNATCIEFHENHTKKVEFYRKFFDKQGVKEINKRVWRVDIS